MPNPFAVDCPTCAKTFKIKNQTLIGKGIICPGCENAFRIDPDQIQKIAPKQAAPKPKSESASKPKPQSKRRKRPAAPAATSDNPNDEWLSALSETESSMSDAEKNNLKSEYEAEPNGNENYYISLAAEQVIQEHWEADKEVEYVDTDYAYDYPADVWKNAKTQWEELSPEQQAARTKEEESGVAGLGSAAMTGSIISSTWSTLGPFDGLWVLLASFTAFRVGANEHEVD